MADCLNAMAVGVQHESGSPWASALMPWSGLVQRTGVANASWKRAAVRTWNGLVLSPPLWSGDHLSP